MATIKRKAYTREPRLKRRQQKIQTVNLIKHQTNDEIVSEETLELTKKIMSVTKVKSKIYKLTTYNKAMSDLLYF